MRRPIGSTGVSASGGSLTLIGRRGAGRQRIADQEIDLDTAIALLEADGYGIASSDPAFAAAVPSADPGAPRFSPGDEVLWRYGQHLEAVRIIRDDSRGLVVWIPSGSARLVPVPADGRRHRDVPLEERFTIPSVMQESTWTGPGIVRVAPAARPWSVWFFRRPDGSPDGAYVNLELPHRRTGGDAPAVFSRDLVLDLWVDAEHVGSEDVWLKDDDELAAVVEQGRFTAVQAEAVRAIADHAGRAFIESGGGPLDEGWAEWSPEPSMDVPAGLPVRTA